MNGRGPSFRPFIQTLDVCNAASRIVFGAPDAGGRRAPSTSTPSLLSPSVDNAGRRGSAGNPMPAAVAGSIAIAAEETRLESRPAGASSLGLDAAPRRLVELADLIPPCASNHCSNRCLTVSFSVSNPPG